MKLIIVSAFVALCAAPLVAGPAQQAPLGIVSDWTLITFTTGIRKTVRRWPHPERPRWLQSWYLHHREAWWPESNPRHREAVPGIRETGACPCRLSFDFSL